MRQARGALKEEKQKVRAELAAIKADCKAATLELREQRARLQRERVELRGACRSDRREARDKGRERIARAKADLDLKRELRREAIKRRARPTLKRTSAEARSESDDAVRDNLPAELVPVFNRVRRTIQAGPRKSRTESFLEWVEAHPDEVTAHQGDVADREAERMWHEHERGAA